MICSFSTFICFLPLQQVNPDLEYTNDIEVEEAPIPSKVSTPHVVMRKRPGRRPQPDPVSRQGAMTSYPLSFDRFNPSDAAVAKVFTSMLL